MPSSRIGFVGSLKILLAQRQRQGEALQLDQFSSFITLANVGNMSPMNYYSWLLTADG